MILREATDADLDNVDIFLRRELAAWGFGNRTTDISARSLIRKGRRRFILVLEGRKIVAVGTVCPIKMDRGPTYELPLLLVSFTHPDWLRTMDALALFIGNLLRSEGIQYVVSRQAEHPHVAGLYDRHGFSPFVTERKYRWVEIEKSIAAIFRERPEWRLSL